MANAERGNRRVETFPIWEMTFNDWPEGVHRIATEKVKWDAKYQKEHDIRTERAKLPEEVQRRIERIERQVYKVLGLSGYARIDLRLTDDGKSFSPVWSPAGDAIAFLRLNGAITDLVMIKLDGPGGAWTIGEETSLTEVSGLDAGSRPGWFIPASELPDPTPTPTPAAPPASAAPASTAP